MGNKTRKKIREREDRNMSYECFRKINMRDQQGKRKVKWK